VKRHSGTSRNPTASRDELLDAILQRVKGPDFPTGALIVGTTGIAEAYRTGHGSITMRAVVETEEVHGRTCLVITELPYQVNPDNLAMKIADLVKENKLQGIADIRDESSGRTGQRLVIVLKRDAVAKVVLNNLYRQTQLQDNFGANMLAIVDGVPQNTPHRPIHHVLGRTPSQRHCASDPVPPRQGGSRRAHFAWLFEGLDALDAVIALIRKSPTVDEAKEGLIKLLALDDIQAMAILNLQLRRLAALERQKIMDQAAEIEVQIAEFNRILADEEVQRGIISEELTHIVEKYGDDRRTAIVPSEGDLRNEDLIPEEEIVVTVTRDGYVKRTRSDNYRSQNRGGKGIKGAKTARRRRCANTFLSRQLIIGCCSSPTKDVYRAKGFEVTEAARDAKGQHIANLLALLPGESVAQILDVRNYAAAEYLTRHRYAPWSREEVEARRLRRQPNRWRLRHRPRGRKGQGRQARSSPTTGTTHVFSTTGGLAAAAHQFRQAVNAVSVYQSRDVAPFCRRRRHAAARPVGRPQASRGYSLRTGDELLSAAVVSVYVGLRVRVVSRERVREAHRGRPVPCSTSAGGIGIKVAKLDRRTRPG